MWMLTSRTKGSCTTLSCSYGNATMWLDIYNSTTNSWLLTNLAQVYGLNSGVDGWATWLYSSYGLFNAWKSGLNTPFPTKQIFSVSITSSGAATLSLFAPTQLFDPYAYTGRIFAVPNLSALSSFDGQRISFVRMNNNEPSGIYWAFSNSNNYYPNGSICIQTQGQGWHAVLRTFVVELYANCTPKHSWANGGILPVRQPPTTNAPYKQMGIVPEWGDMLAAISPDGNYVVVATNEGPPGTTDGCEGYGYVLQNTNIPNSGQSARIAQWCPLAKNSTTGQITCSTSMTVLNQNTFNPPGSNPVPSFIAMSGGMTVIFNVNWAQYETADYWQIWQNNLGADYQQFLFGTNGNTIGAVQPIY